MSVLVPNRGFIGVAGLNRNPNGTLITDSDTWYGDSTPGDGWSYVGQQAWSQQYNGGPNIGNATRSGTTGIWKKTPPAPAPAAPAPAPVAAPPPPPKPSGTPTGPTVSDDEAAGRPGPWSLQGGKKEDVVETKGFLDTQLERTDTDYDQWLAKQPSGGSSESNSDWDRYFKDEYTSGRPLLTRAGDHNKGGRRMAGGGDFLSDLNGIAGLGNPSRTSL